jgi:hypothetical protein
MELLSDTKPSTWINSIGLIFILIGTIFILLAIKSTQENHVGHNWSQVVATLKNIEVEKQIHEGDSDDNHRRYVSYFCVLTYQYEVSGHTLSAKKSKRVETYERALVLSQDYSIGEKTSIFYEQHYPENYRFNLEPEYHGLLWLLPFCAFSGFGLTIIHIRKMIHLLTENHLQTLSQQIR